MSKEIDWDLICDYYSRLERQGPGSRDTTGKALGYVDGLNDDSHIADIGCGTGGQTLELAEVSAGKIVGIDLLEPFIQKLNEKAGQLNLSSRVSGRVASMEELPFKDESLDLIWSEGAIYNMGFENGLRTWWRFIKPDGYIAVSEISWLTDERPDEINDFWNTAYPEIDTVANKVSVMQQAGYEVVASFVLPESCWIDNYYAPQKEIMDDFLKAYPDSAAAEALVTEQRQEADLYQRFKYFYGYAFYIGRKK